MNVPSSMVLHYFMYLENSCYFEGFGGIDELREGFSKFIIDPRKEEQSGSPGFMLGFRAQGSGFEF